MSPSRKPVLSFAHYFQAPATQATRGGGRDTPKSARVILKEIQSCKVWVVLFSGPNHAYTATAQKMLDVCNKALSEVSHCVLGCCDVIIIVVQLL